jgi:HD-GYP domain-containing protein (c-di-GMP phosphodiesterase class II)
MVVDCFDALTSDRPYRPRFETAAALQVLIDRRGTMYDPQVVDGFLELHSAGLNEVPPATEPLSPIRMLRRSNDHRGCRRDCA